MPAIGITGGISTGKSSLVECLREILEERTPQRGVPTMAAFFDADLSARELADKDPEVRGLIEKEFGAGIYSEGGDLNRKQVRSIVFADADKKRALEQILHPRIRRQWSLEAERHRNSDKLFFADIPLLYETGGETLCDRVVVVACSRRVQLERLMKRMGLDEAAAQQMIFSQMPLAEKIARADHVIWNNGGLAELKEQARLLVNFWTRK